MEQEPQTQSPSAVTVKEAEMEPLMNFPDAIKAMTDGKKITKVEWRDKTIWGELVDDILKMHINGRYLEWTINGGDLRGEDFFVIN